MPRSTFTIEGMDELKAAFARLGAATSRSTLEGVALKALRPVEESARRYVPVRTGKLRDSIRSQIWKSSPSLIDAEVYVGERYGHLVEYGHGGPHAATAHPFLRPAWDANKGAAESIAAAELGKIIEQAAT